MGSVGLRQRTPKYEENGWGKILIDIEINQK